MNRLKYVLLELKNIFANIPMVSKIFLLIYLIIIFSIYFESILKGVLVTIIYLLTVFIFILLLTDME